MKMNGSRMVCESLVAEGVRVVFGLPGGAIMPLYDVLPDYPIKHVLVRHEQGAAHMADGYGRASGDVVMVRAPVTALDDLVVRLVHGGIGLRELALVISPLEAAFLALTERQEGDR